MPFFCFSEVRKRHISFKNEDPNANGEVILQPRKKDHEYLYVIVPFINYSNLSAHIARLKKCLTSIHYHAGVRIVLIEAIEKGRTPVINKKGFRIFMHIKVNLNYNIWMMENIVNVAIRHLPKSWRWGAAININIEFLNKNWVHDAIVALKKYDMIQLFQSCIYMNRHNIATGVNPGYIYGEIMNTVQYNHQEHYHGSENCGTPFTDLKTGEPSGKVNRKKSYSQTSLPREDVSGRNKNKSGHARIETISGQDKHDGGDLYIKNMKEDNELTQPTEEADCPQQQEDYENYAYGLAWGFTNKCVRKIGRFLDFNIYGSNDYLQSLALMGKLNDVYLKTYNPGLRLLLMDYQNKCLGIKTGYIHGNIMCNDFLYAEKEQHGGYMTLEHVKKLDINKDIIYTLKGCITLTKDGEMYYRRSEDII